MDELIGAAIAEGAEASSVLHGAGAASVAVSLPGRVVGNEEVAERAGVSPDWIVERTGVETRRHAEDGDRLFEYAAEAGTAALAKAGLEPGQVDLVLVATMSHDHMTPAAAPLAAQAMRCDRAGAMDLNSACTGFVSALAMASGQIESGRCDNAVVIGVDLLSRFTDPSDRGTAALFGDGAGAVVLGRTAGPSRIGPAVFGADGSRSELIEVEREEGLIRMKGPDTYRQAVDRLGESTLEAVGRAGLDLDRIDLFVFHQANGRILDAVADRLGLPGERVINSIRTAGNTSAGSIPIALAQAEDEGLLDPGSKVLLSAFGGGLSWGALTLDWGLADAA